MGEEQARIGVFVCHCGTNIGGFVDVPAVTEYSEKLPGVVYAERNLYTCSADGVRAIKNKIKEHNLDRVIVASCTPRTHAPLFKSTCKEAGVNPYLFEFVNIRDQCSWVHMREPERATEKAKDLIRMGVAKATLLEPSEDISIDIEPSVMIIGAGVSGLTSALTLAKQGFAVHLIEKKEKVGGKLKDLYKLYPTNQKSYESLKPLIDEVEKHERVKLYTSTVINEVNGYIGNFNVTLDKNGEEEKIKVGTIIIATGAEDLEPEGLYGYGEYDNVITQAQLEGVLKEGKLGKPNRVVMIQCVGSRGQVVSYCSKICCMTAIKNAIIIREESPETEVVVLHNDIQVYGSYEDDYLNAKELGVKFRKYSPDKRPEVSKEGEKLSVKFINELLGAEKDYETDLLVLSTPLIQNPDASDISKLLKVPLGQDKFFFEAHVKLRPVDFATDGIYLCGTARGPADVTESVEQALGAASRASIPMWVGKYSTEAINSIIDPETCIGCGICMSLCPFGAIIEVEDGTAQSIRALCKGCGTCVAACPKKAIQQLGFTDDQIRSQIKAVFVEGGV